MENESLEIDFWLGRVQQARLRYDAARQLVCSVMVQQFHNGSDSRAVFIAHQEERSAMEEYAACLRRFSDLVMRNGSR